MDAWWQEVWQTLQSEFADIGDARQLTQITLRLLIAGIGFLGAGTILKGKEEDTDQHVKGLTTAAGLWMTAAIGVAAGLGKESTAVLSTVLALLVFSVMPRIVKLLDKP